MIGTLSLPPVWSKSLCWDGGSLDVKQQGHLGNPSLPESKEGAKVDRINLVLGIAFWILGWFFCIEWTEEWEEKQKSIPYPQVSPCPEANVLSWFLAIPTCSDGQHCEWKALRDVKSIVLQEGIFVYFYCVFHRGKGLGWDPGRPISYSNLSPGRETGCEKKSKRNLVGGHKLG